MPTAPKTASARSRRTLNCRRPPSSRPTTWPPKAILRTNLPMGMIRGIGSTQAGYNFSFAGENLAVYFSDSNDVNTAWMNSPEHRANLLDPRLHADRHRDRTGLVSGRGNDVRRGGIRCARARSRPRKRRYRPRKRPPHRPSRRRHQELPNVAGASVAPAKPKVQVVAQERELHRSQKHERTGARSPGRCPSPRSPPRTPSLRSS